MSNRAILARYFAEFASQREAAETLKVSEATVSRLLSGKRRVTLNLAERMERAQPKYHKAALLWGDNNKQHGSTS